MDRVHRENDFAEHVVHGDRVLVEDHNMEHLAVLSLNFKARINTGQPNIKQRKQRWIFLFHRELAVSQHVVDGDRVLVEDLDMQYLAVLERLKVLCSY